MFAKEGDAGSVKLVDFGLSAQYNRKQAGELTEKCGTLAYMAPEVYSSYQYTKVSSRKSYQISMWTYGASASLCT